MLNKSNFYIQSKFTGKSIISIDQFDQKSIMKLMKETKGIFKMSMKKRSSVLKGKLVTLLFFEPSSRTFSSFSSAIKRLGGQTIEYQNPLQTSSSVKGETIEDTVRVFEQYTDMLIIRHPKAGIPKIAAETTLKVPVINAGDGINEHPTQALLDLFTIFQKHKKLNNLKGLIVGDLLNGRTVHSLIKAFSKFKHNTLYLLAPKQLHLTHDDVLKYKKAGVNLISISSLQEIPGDCHFWYWTRVQKERFSDSKEYEKLKTTYILTTKLLKEKGNKKLICMHPLPRVGEIATDVDSDPRAVYLTDEVKNGMIVRMALLKLILS